MYRFIALILLPVLLFSACVSGSKTYQLFRAGTVSEPEYRLELPFEERSGLIVIPVTIGGEIRQFLLDTGAPNVITPQLAESLNLKTELTRQVRDTHGNSNPLDFVRIDSLALGGIVFYDMGAIIGDLKASPELACLGIDGLLGANLLSKTFMQIDYQNKKVILASHLDSIQVDSSALIWPFYTTAQGSPEVKIRVNGELLGPLTVDTGSTSWIGAPQKPLAKVKEGGPVQIRRTFGSASTGLFGEAKSDSLYKTWIEDLTLPDSTSLPPGSVDFFGENRSLVGNAYLKQFVLTFDWQADRLFLEPTGFSNAESLQTFGFSPSYRDGQFLVRFVWEGSQADQEGLRSGDRILFMNGMDFINMDAKVYCRYLRNAKMREDWQELDLLVEQDGATRQFKLQKESFFK